MVQQRSPCQVFLLIVVLSSGLSFTYDIFGLNQYYSNIILYKNKLLLYQIINVCMSALIWKYFVGLVAALCWRPLMSTMLETADGPMALDGLQGHCCSNFSMTPSCDPDACRATCMDRLCDNGICKTKQVCHCSCA